MTDLHPHWHNTGADAEEHDLPVRIVEKPKQEPKPFVQNTHPPRMRRLSRQPAAIAGMLLAVSVGLSLFFSMDSGAETIIRITPHGFAPQNVSVEAGSTIQWINETDRPHILQSDVLCTRDQRCFSTASIAPGKTASLIITEEFVNGKYPYFSISTQGMEASITVLAGTRAQALAAKPSAQQNLAQATPFGAGEAANTPPPPPAGTAASSAALSSLGTMAFALPPADDDGFINVTSILTGADSNVSRTGNQPPATAYPNAVPSGASFSAYSSVASLPVGRDSAPVALTTLPMNPYTVNSTRAHPFDAEGKPLAAGSNVGTTETLHSGAPRPLAQPATGPALWTTILGAFVLLFFVTRTLLRKPAI